MPLLVWAWFLALTPGEPEAAVRRLGAPTFAAREAASREMEDAPRACRRALEGALTDPDPEVRRRARLLLDGGGGGGK
jgi:hypothetical protein